MHAKIFVADTPAGTRVFTGSANATVAAFKQNVEVLLELRASGRAAAVASWLKRAPRDAAGRAKQRVFRDLLVEHEWGDITEVETELGVLLDKVQRAIAAVPVIVDVGELTDGTYRVVYSEAEE